MKDIDRQLIVLALAAMFQTARLIGQDGERRNPKASFDDAEKFVKEAEKRFGEIR